MHITKTISVVQELRSLTLHSDGSMSCVFTTEPNGGAGSDSEFVLSVDDARKVISAADLGHIKHDLYSILLAGNKLQGTITD